MLTQEQTTVTMKGKPVTLQGRVPAVGQAAPDFTALANDLSTVQFRAATRGKVCILSAVPSLDTSVCSIETRRFSEEAHKLGADVTVWTISMDLPFGQKRWCTAEHVDNVKMISDHRDGSFGKAYGVLIPDLRLLARAVFVIDKQGTIQFVQVVPEISTEPDYNAVLDAVRKLSGK